MGWGGGPWDFSVSPRPFGFGFETKGLRVWGQGLTNGFIHNFKKCKITAYSDTSWAHVRANKFETWFRVFENFSQCFFATLYLTLNGFKVLDSYYSLLNFSALMMTFAPRSSHPCALACSMQWAPAGYLWCDQSWLQCRGAYIFLETNLSLGPL